MVEFNFVSEKEAFKYKREIMRDMKYSWKPFREKWLKIVSLIKFYLNYINVND